MTRLVFRLVFRLEGSPPPLGPAGRRPRPAEGPRLVHGSTTQTDEEGKRARLSADSGSRVTPASVCSIYVHVSGNVYTGAVDGKLWRIGPDDRVTIIAQMGQCKHGHFYYI